MFYINRRNLYIRILVALLIIASVGIALLGGFDYVNAHNPNIESPSEPYTKTDPLNPTTIQAHVFSVSNNPEYTIRYTESIWASQQLKDIDVITTVSNEERIGYQQKQMESKLTGTHETSEYYETEDEIHRKENGEISQVDKSDGSYDSPMLENQFVAASFGLDPFLPFEWALNKTTKEAHVYNLSRIDAVAVDHINSIDDAEGTLKIDKEKGYIQSITVHVWGSSNEYPTETLYIKYEYTVTLGSSIEKPEWTSN